MSKKKNDDRPVMDRLRIRWHFDDGTSDVQPFREHADQIKDQAMKASFSNDAELRSKGINLLGEHSDKFGESRARLEYSKLTGRQGGQAPKKNMWACIAAEKLARETHNAKYDVAWLRLPKGDSAWNFEHPDNKFIVIDVYRDGDKLHFIDSDSNKPASRALTKSSFLKQYYRPAKKPGK